VNAHGEWMDNAAAEEQRTPPATPLAIGDSTVFDAGSIANLNF